MTLIKLKEKPTYPLTVKRDPAKRAEIKDKANWPLRLTWPFDNCCYLFPTGIAEKGKERYDRA